jgi:beta-glucosidase
MALDAGVDMELPFPDAYTSLIAQVKAGRIAEARVDQSVARVLRMKFLAGLFDDPYSDPAAAE